MKMANRNLIMLGLPAALILICGIILFAGGGAILQTAQDITPELPDGEVGDVEGYGFLIESIGAGLGWFAGFAVQFFALMAILYGGIILVLSVIARIVYNTTPGRILAYRILMTIDLVFMLLPAPELIRSLADSAANGNFSAALLILLILLFLLAAFGFYNTFSPRLKEKRVM